MEEEVGGQGTLDALTLRDRDGGDDREREGRRSGMETVGGLRLLQTHSFSPPPPPCQLFLKRTV